jgi:hypothetical protein
MATRRNRCGAGQTRWSESEARAVMAAWEESGLSGAAYARMKGIGSERLFWWRSRFAREASLTKPVFVPVIAKASPERASAALIVTTSRGSRIEVCEVDAETAAWVVAVLAGEIGA